MSTNIFAYKQGSASARALADALGVRLIKHQNSAYRGTADKVVINWGASALPDPVLRAGRIINPPEALARATNKRNFFRACGDAVRVPEWTTDSREAELWLVERGAKIVCRQTLTGHSGHGIIIFDDPDALEFPLVPLYVKYKKKSAEFRVHFAFGEPIDVQRKVRDPNREPVDWNVRSHANGFIFVRNGVRDAVPEDVWAQAAAAVQAAQVDFGAVDVIWNDHEQRAYVLEINSAPGLEGETVNSYANAFRRELGL